MGFLFRLLCLASLIGAARTTQDAVSLQDGDVVLQASRSARSTLIRKASNSPYSHVGLVEVTAAGIFVIEAAGPVARTPWATWVARGESGRFTVLRPKALDEAARRRVVRAALKNLGKPYDARYRWDDERLYCSELVVKAFAQGANRTVGRQQLVKELSLSSSELAYAAKLGVSPEQKLVTPGSLYEDDSFERVYEMRR